MACSVCVAVDVVTVELYGVATTLLVAYGKVPTASNAEVGAARDDCGQLWVVDGQLGDNLSCFIRGMVVYHDKVEGKVGFL